MRHRSLICALAVAAAVWPPVYAADQPKHNSLTADEVAAGWILLFDGETTFGWKIDGAAKVEDGVLVLGGSKATTAESTTSFDWQNTAFHMEASWKGNKAPSFTLLGEEGWYQLNDSSKGAFVPQKTKSEGTPSEIQPQRFRVPAGSELRLRNVKCRPLGLRPLFNGKDFTGWREVRTPRTQSRFSVTDTGEINVRNGPGELQTETQWGDFVLQLEIIANGRHLNGGVFFRATPGQLWSGYESQVSNQWEGEDRTQPVDWGTGGIYNRQPARRVVPDDGQWFTETIVVHGNHMAVWVDGYQVSDFTDTRPPHQNPRKGCRLQKGAIGLQGFNPATDLSFRNLRIRALRRNGGLHGQRPDPKKKI